MHVVLERGTLVDVVLVALDWLSLHGHLARHWLTLHRLALHWHLTLHVWLLTRDWHVWLLTLYRHLWLSLLRTCIIREKGMFDSVVELLNILLLDFSQLVPAFNDRCIEAIQVSKCVDEEIDVLHALVDGCGRDELTEI